MVPRHIQELWDTALVEEVLHLFEESVRVREMSANDWGGKEREGF